APAAPRLPETVSLEPVLAPAPAFAPVLAPALTPAPDLSVLTSAPTFAPAEPWAWVPCAAASWLNDTASTPEIITGNNLRITLFLRLWKGSTRRILQSACPERALHRVPGGEW